MFTNASREVVSMDGDVGNNDSTSTGNVKDDETKSTSPAEQLQDESMSNLEDDDESPALDDQKTGMFGRLYLKDKTQVTLFAGDVSLLSVLAAQ